MSPTSSCREKRRTAWFLMGIGGLLLVLIAAGGYWLSTGPDLSLPRPYIFEGESMEPTLRSGDRLLMRPLSRGDSPQRDDIVLFTDPSRPDLRLVLLNGQPLEEPYLGRVNPVEQFDSVAVPEGHIWVMGDNRARSFDSRQLGPIPLEYVIGVRVR